MNPIDDAMLAHDLNSRNPTRQPARPHRRCVAGLACLSLTLGPGCGLSDGASRSGASVEIIKGKDSAGATIELEKRGGDLTRARVIDVVLGTGEAEIISTTDGGVEFTIEFPAGATITYLGSVEPPSAPSAQAVAGTWAQHAEGIFGEDTGTWEAAADPVHGADR